MDYSNIFNFLTPAWGHLSTQQGPKDIKPSAVSRKSIDISYKNIESLQEELIAERASKNEIQMEYQEHINKLNLSNMDNQESNEGHKRQFMAKQLEDKAKITEQAVKIDELQQVQSQLEVIAFIFINPILLYLIFYFINKLAIQLLYTLLKK